MEVKIKDYVSVRDKIQSGDLLCCSGNGFFSWLIKRYTKKPILLNKDAVKFTHVGTFVWVFNQLFVVEAVGKVRMVRMSEAYKNYKGSIYVIRPSISREINDDDKHLTTQETNIFVTKQLELVGKPYDWKNIIRIAENKGMKVNSKWYCSEMVNYARNYFYTGGRRKQVMPQDIVLKEKNFLWKVLNVR